MPNDFVVNSNFNTGLVNFRFISFLNLREFQKTLLVTPKFCNSSSINLTHIDVDIKVIDKCTSGVLSWLLCLKKDILESHEWPDAYLIQRLNDLKANCNQMHID